MIRRFVFLTFILLSFNVFPQDSSQTFLSLKSTGVEDFLASHPTYDGRGTIILVLDTGVDMGIEGLTKTSTGEVKVIDVQDFTGQGDVKLEEAKLNRASTSITLKSEDEKLSIKGIEKLADKPVDNKYYIGNFNESRFRNSNSGVKDLNGNGKRDDNFVVIVYKTKDIDEEFWAAYIDTDADGDLGDEKLIRTYREDPSPFFIKQIDKISYLTLGLNIFPDEKRVNIFFDDGGHGTHVAGIAAGYKIGNQNLNGVAPGAKVIGLKLGENTLSGGATITLSMRKCFLYADSLSKQRKEPCIINMSYGVGSVIEGLSDMELFLDSLLDKNPYLYVCVSNGNNGPGISTSGLPAAARNVFSSGAVLTKEVGRENYGASLTEDVILHFSSRGGEVPKPDVCTPGAAVSTVTNWSGGDKMWGTSMASPYTSGVMALLLSGAKQKYPDVKIPSQLLFKAVRNSAVKLEGYNILDQGGGYINAVNAFNLLEEYIRNHEYEKFQTYQISSFAPTMPGEKAPALYIRNGSFISDDDTYKFNISLANPNKGKTFYRIYNLKSDSDWLTPVQKKINLRNIQSASVSVRFDKSKMKEPGLYTGKITGYRDDKTHFPEFDLVASVIIPYQFTSENNYTQSWQEEKLMPARHKRYFINVPAGSGSMLVDLKSEEGIYSNTLYRVFDPDGVNIHTSGLLNTNNGEISVNSQHYDLKPGVYEIVVHSYFLSTKESQYNLSVKFSGLQSLNKELILDYSDPKISLVNNFDEEENYDIAGKIIGYQREFEVTFSGNTEQEFPFILRKDESSKTFTFNISKEDFNKFTDFAMLIFDTSGNAIVKESLDYPGGDITVTNYSGADSIKLILKIVPAFANYPSELTFSVTEKTEAAIPEDFQVLFRGDSRTKFYPGVEKKVICQTRQPKFYYPAGTYPFGEVHFRSVKTKLTELILPFTIKIEE